MYFDYYLDMNTLPKDCAATHSASQHGNRASVSMNASFPSERRTSCFLMLNRFHQLCIYSRGLSLTSLLRTTFCSCAIKFDRATVAKSTSFTPFIFCGKPLWNTNKREQNNTNEKCMKILQIWVKFSIQTFFIFRWYALQASVRHYKYCFLEGVIFLDIIQLITSKCWTETKALFEDRE